MWTNEKKTKGKETSKNLSHLFRPKIEEITFINHFVKVNVYNLDMHFFFFLISTYLVPSRPQFMV
jgi:hypothetical protein